MERKGLFITFEGIDGCGKTTQFRRLQELLSQAGIEYLATREPGGSEAGERIRQILIDSSHLALTPKAEVFLFLANRNQNIHEVVKPAVAAGKIVLSDRHRDSSTAFQGSGRGLGLEWVEKLNDEACDDFPPDCTILLDISVEVSRERARKRDSDAAQAKHVDRFEREGSDFHIKIWEGYQALAKKYPERFLVIDATPSIDEVTKALVGALTQRYPEHFTGIQF